MTREPNTDLEKLIEKARGVKMTSAQREEQRRSFAYGNAKIENERITRSTIDLAAEKLAKEKRESDKP